MVADSVLYEVAEGIATVTLNRPERMNAIGDDMLERLLGSLERADSDDGVRALVLTGAGRSFCPGMDMQSLARVGQRPQQGSVAASTQVGRSRSWMRTSELLREMPKITIAAVNGACAGAGFAMALACDLRFCARSAVFRTAYVGVGVSGDYGINWFLPRIVGWGKARELLFLNDKIRPDEALRIGLVARIAEDDVLVDEVRTVATSLAGAPTAGVIGMKQNLLEAESLSLAEELNRESTRLQRSLGTEESRAAARAFLDRRR